MRVLLSLLLPLACAAVAVKVKNQAPVVDLSYAKYKGYSNASTGINYFRGIPYAQPPVNDLRWRKPRSIEHDNSLIGRTISATQIAPACYQGLPEMLSSYTEVVFSANQSEDCLTLDVLVPAEPVSTALPVLVQIHGGGYTFGSAQSVPGDALVHASHGKPGKGDKS